VLFAANVWKAAVSGSWDDASKWSLGTVPTRYDDVQINVAGNYTVTLPATGDYRYVKSLKVGGGTGTQTLALNRALYIEGGWLVAAGDNVNVEAGGNFYAYGTTGSTATLDGTINLKATSSRGASLQLYPYSINGTGKIIGATGGSYVRNYCYFGGSTINSGITLSGRNLNVYNLINKGTIKVEGGTTDEAYFTTLNNQGAFSAGGGTKMNFDTLTNAAGKTINVNGSPLRITGYNYVNNGTINVSNTTIEYGQTFSTLGTVNRTNVNKILFSGVYDGKGGNFNFNATMGQWIWYGGQLQNGNYDPTNPYAPKVDLVQGRSYALLYKVNLTGNLVIPAGFYINSQQGLNIAAGKSITLNGSLSGGAGLYVYGATLGGSGEVILAGTSGRNTLAGNGITIGSGVTVRGHSGSLGGGMINNGTIIADVAGGTITINDVVNQGNIIAAPGKFKVYRYDGKSSGALTIGIGGTSAGSSYGQFNFSDANYVPTLAGAINAVTLGAYLPGSGTSFTAATFTKAPTGTFATKNLDAGNNVGFDLAQSPTNVVLKAKGLSGGLASRSGTAVTVNGTSAADTIVAKQQLGILYATVGTRTSVFYDRPLTAVTINAGDNNDTVTYAGNRGARLNGGNGNDKLTGGSGNDVIDGGAGSDALIGAGGDDTYLFANSTVAETDIVTELSGGGVDTLDFGASTVNVTVKLNSDAALAVMTNRTVKTAAAGQFAFWENAYGGSGADNLLGNNAANILRGNNGNDTLTGGAGADSLYGGENNDTLFGGGDNVKDLLDGGNGTDVKGSADLVDQLVSVP
jgi:hypothetical protein